MGININDLDNNPNLVGTSLLSENETILDNLCELSDEELKTCGGGSVVVTGGGFPVYGVPVGVGVPVYSAPVSGFGGGFGGSNITFNVSSNSTSNSVANAYYY